MEVNSSDLPLREAAARDIVGRHIPPHLLICLNVHTKATSFLGFSQPMTEHGGVLAPGYSCNEAFLWRQSFLWDSSLAWSKLSQNCASPVQSSFLPSVLFQVSDLHHVLKAHHTYSCLDFSLSFICVFPNKSLEHLILSCCLFLGGCGLTQQEFYSLFMV